MNSLEAALWAFHNNSTFKDGCLLVGREYYYVTYHLITKHCIVNLGNDADTTAAIYGQIAGAYYGADGIPEEWRRKCSLHHLIEIFAKELVRQSAHIVCSMDTELTLPSSQSG